MSLIQADVTCPSCQNEVTEIDSVTLRCKPCDEELGIKMLVALQALAGIEEPRAVALANWQQFSDREKHTTCYVYDTFGLGD